MPTEQKRHYVAHYQAYNDIPTGRQLNMFIKPTN